MNWFIVWFAACAFFAFCFFLVHRGMKKASLLEDDQITPEKPFPPSAGLRPEEGERPFPGPTVVHLSLSDRLERRDHASPRPK